MHILMTTMQLEIGGAETHIVELSKALKNRGIEITVASNGGAYEKELTDAGIRHVKIPFHSKNPVCMLKAYKLLKKLIFEEKFDVVHAHARIPAFLCSILHKRYHFRFVTTAHWVFSTRFPYNLLTRWGERSLAVSDDIKTYLIDNYKIPAENIRVTINGINLDKFSKDTPFDDIKEEFSLEDGKKRIVYVSRMDKDRSLAAHKLIEASEELALQFHNLEIIIVGGGNDYETIEAEAEAANEKVGRNFIITTGSRTDINKFTASGDIFIGVSRAALEAMACEKPSIIAGNEGYIGIFDESKFKISYDTNFCCRGCEMTTTDVLKEDVKKLLLMSEEELSALGKYSRETVKEHYSMDTMADDSIRMYLSVIKNSLINEVSPEEFATVENYLIPNPLRDRGLNSDIVISGYYGFDNSGDDSILRAIIQEFKTFYPSIRIVALSKKPEETSKLYGIESVNRLDFIKIIRKIRHTKLLISGGGSLIQDVTSNKSLFYYLSIIKIAEFFKKKVMLYANGIGPVTNKNNYKHITSVLNNVDLITLREPSSYEEIKSYGVDKPEISITADPAFNLFTADDTEVNEILTKNGIPGDTPYCVIALRPWKTMAQDFSTQIASISEYLYNKYNIASVFVKMQPIHDTEITKRVFNEVSTKAFFIKESLTPTQLLGLINKAELTIGMRLHTLIYSIKCNTPAIGIVYDPKVDSLMDYSNHPYKVPVEDPNPLTLERYVDEIMDKKDDIKEQLKAVAEDFSDKATENTRLALKLIGK